MATNLEILAKKYSNNYYNDYIILNTVTNLKGYMRVYDETQPKDDSIDEKFYKITSYHPNIVYINNIFRDFNLKTYYVFKYNPLTTFPISKVKHKIKNIEDFVIQLIAQSLHGLTYLHAHNLNHGFLSHHNIHVTKDGLVKLIRTKNDQYPIAWGGGLIPTTPDDYRNYYGPHSYIYEIPCNIHADVWSLGLIALELIIGRYLEFGSKHQDEMIKFSVLQKSFDEMNDYLFDLIDTNVRDLQLRDLLKRMLNCSKGTIPSVLLRHPIFHEQTEQCLNNKILEKLIFYFSSNHDMNTDIKKLYWSYFEIIAHEKDQYKVERDPKKLEAIKNKAKKLITLSSTMLESLIKPFSEKMKSLIDI